VAEEASALEELKEALSVVSLLGVARQRSLC
jgi:hypothetical protein